MQFVQRVKQDGSLSKLTFHAHTALCRTPSVSVASLRRAQGARWFFSCCRRRLQTGQSSCRSGYGSQGRHWSPSAQHTTRSGNAQNCVIVLHVVPLCGNFRPGSGVAHLQQAVGLFVHPCRSAKRLRKTYFSLLHSASSTGSHHWLCPFSPGTSTPQMRKSAVVSSAVPVLHTGCNVEHVPRVQFLQGFVPLPIVAARQPK